MNLKVIDTSTGEIVKELEPGDMIIKKKSKEFLEDTMEFGNGEKFIKLYTSILQDLAGEELSGSEWKVLVGCIKHLSYISGAIKYETNGNFLTPQDIVKETGLNRSSVFRAIDTLTKKNIFHKGRTGKEFQLFANPFLFTKGSRINKTLYDMFKKTKWAKIHKDEVKKI